MPVRLPHSHIGLSPCRVPIVLRKIDGDGWAAHVNRFRSGNVIRPSRSFADGMTAGYTDDSRCRETSEYDRAFSITQGAQEWHSAS